MEETVRWREGVGVEGGSVQKNEGVKACDKH